MNAIFLCNHPQDIKRVYAPVTMAVLKEKAGLKDTVYTVADLQAQPREFADVQYVFSTWGMPEMTEEQIKTLLPSLKAVFYAAGSVQFFARPFLNCGVKVFSAWAANAVPVAEYTVAQILLANKGYYATAALMSSGKTDAAYALRAKYPGNFGEKVGIIGAGMIGKLVIQMLKAYHLQVLVFDPFLSDEKAEELGVLKCDLATLFEECQVVSNHLANNAETKKMLHYDLFKTMRPYATFLNTGRGAQVVEADLATVLSERPDLTAILDVTEPEPPLPDNPFFTLPNCLLTPHIAGSSGDEVCRMADFMCEEFMRLINGDACRYEVTNEMLKTMA